AQDAAFMKQQPGFISTQLHCGTAGSTTFVNVAVWESARALGRAFGSPEFQALLARYPADAVAAPHVFTKVAVPGICLGEPTIPPAMDPTHSATDGIATGKVNRSGSQASAPDRRRPLGVCSTCSLAAPSSVGGGRPTGPVAGRAQLGPVRATIGASRYRTPQIAYSARANVKIVKWRGVPNGSLASATGAPATLCGQRRAGWHGYINPGRCPRCLRGRRPGLRASMPDRSRRGRRASSWP